VCYSFSVDEGRKRVLLIAATILAARKLAQFDKPCPGIEAAISDGLTMAEKIMAKIDAKYPGVKSPGAKTPDAGPPVAKRWDKDGRYPGR
jgi:hypothetical protein